MSIDIAQENVDDRGSRQVDRTPYQFTSDQALKMAASGIFTDAAHVELLDGVFYTLTRDETHNLIVGMLSDLIKPLLSQVEHVREEKPVRKDGSSLPEPDIAVCRGDRKHYWPDLPTLDRLALVVEVSHSSEKADRIVKFAMYAAAEIPTYWIVDVERRRVEVWTNAVTIEGETARYATVNTYEPGQTIPVNIDGEPRGEIAVAELFPPERQA